MLARKPTQGNAPATPGEGMTGAPKNVPSLHGAAGKGKSCSARGVPEAQAVARAALRVA